MRDVSTVGHRRQEHNLKSRIEATPQDHILQREAKSGTGEEMTLAEQVYRSLRRDIISGALEAGRSLRLE